MRQTLSAADLKRLQLCPRGASASRRAAARLHRRTRVQHVLRLHLASLAEIESRTGGPYCELIAGANALRYFASDCPSIRKERTNELRTRHETLRGRSQSVRAEPNKVSGLREIE